MFTGLVEEKAIVSGIHHPSGDEGDGENTRLVIEASIVGEAARIGDSISINGCCLTVVSIKSSELQFDAVPETLQRTNLGGLKPGDPVNLERALLPDTRMGGHYVTGHIDGIGQVRQIDEHPDWKKFHVTVAGNLASQMACKGSVAIDGVSLTLVDVDSDCFSVVLIPHTLDVTTIGTRVVGDDVNIETDLLAKYVERQLQFMKSTSKPT